MVTFVSVDDIQVYRKAFNVVTECNVVKVSCMYLYQMPSFEVFHVQVGHYG